MPFIALLFLINILIFCYGTWPKLVQEVGLLIDILGAVILAIPDVPLIWNRTYSGRLNKGFEELSKSFGVAVLYEPEMAEELNFPDDDHIGFDEILVTLRDTIYLDASDPNSPIQSAPDIEWQDVYRMGIGIAESEPHDTELIFYNSAMEEEYSMGSDGSMWIIEQMIDRQKRRIRRAGLALLIIGFTQQLLPVFVSNP
jgi:hypothetical protein